MRNDPKALAPAAPAFPQDWPRLGLGCSGLGNTFHDWTETQAAATFTAAWDCGIRYFDTAPWYGHGLSEIRLGGLIRSHPRAQSLVSTKVGRFYLPAARGQDARGVRPNGLNFAHHFDYSAEGFALSLAQSRLRLGQSAVDALVIHDLDRDYHGAAWDGHMAALTGSGLAYLQGLKAAGEISAIGMGINTTEDFARVADWIDVDFFLVAMPYTLADQPALHGPMATSLRRGVRVVIGAPFASGLLADPDNPAATWAYGAVPEALRTRVRAIRDGCARHGVPLKAAALQFPLLHPAVISVLPGATSPAELRENAALIRHPIPPDLWAELKALGLIDRAAPTG